MQETKRRGRPARDETTHNPIYAQLRIQTWSPFILSKMQQTLQ
jgi:hypothetical protein